MKLHKRIRRCPEGHMYWGDAATPCPQCEAMNKQEINEIPIEAGIPARPTYTQYGLLWDDHDIPVRLSEGDNYLCKETTGRFSLADWKKNDCSVFFKYRDKGFYLDDYRLQHGDTISAYGIKITFVNMDLMGMDSPGRNVCKALRKLRKQIADANDIPFESRICHETGICPGTCPACEAESRYLTEQLNNKVINGEKLAEMPLTASPLNNMKYGGFQVMMVSEKEQ